MTPLAGIQSDVLRSLAWRADNERKAGRFDEATVWENYALALRAGSLNVALFDAMLVPPGRPGALQLEDMHLLACMGGCSDRFEEAFGRAREWPVDDAPPTVREIPLAVTRNVC